MARTTANPPTEAERKKRKRAAIIKFSLAGVALLGIGAAATSAAWTDDAWFKASATSGNGSSVELQGSVDGLAWINADTDPATGTDFVNLTLPTNLLANLVPGDHITVPLQLRNHGSIPLTVTGAITKDAGALWTVAGADGIKVGTALTTGTTTHVAFTSQVVPANDSTTVVNLDVTVPNWTNADAAAVSSKTGTLTVKFTGTTAGKTDF